MLIIRFAGFKLGFNYLKAKRMVDAIDICHHVSSNSVLKGLRHTFYGDNDHFEIGFNGLMFLIILIIVIQFYLLTV